MGIEKDCHVFCTQLHRIEQDGRQTLAGLVLDARHYGPGCGKQTRVGATAESHAVLHCQHQIYVKA